MSPAAIAAPKIYCAMSTISFFNCSFRQITLRRWSSAPLFGSFARLAMVNNRELGAAFHPPSYALEGPFSRSLKALTIVNSYSPRRPSDRSYRREPLPNISELDLEEEVARIDMDPKKLLQKGDPNSMQAIIKDVMPVGYFVTLPTGRDGYLPADDLGFTGGLAILQRLFKEGQEITVRIVCRGGAGREIVSCKKPEFAPPSEQKTIESMRLHFEQEKKNRMNPRNRRHQNYY